MERNQLKMDVIYYFTETNGAERVAMLLDVAKRDAAEKNCALNKVVIADSMEKFETEADRSFSDTSVDFVVVFNVKEMEKSVIQTNRS